MSLDKQNAIKTAELYVTKKYSGSKDLSNLHYIVVGSDSSKGEFYAQENFFCPNDRESDNIPLEQGEFLVKVFRNKEPGKILRSYPNLL
jgi:hypothetical protein